MEKFVKIGIVPIKRGFTDMVSALEQKDLFLKKCHQIAPEAVDPEDVEMLEDLITAAVNEALRQYEAASDATVSKITGGMKLGF